MSTTTVLRLPVQPLSDVDRAELEQSIARHPAGKGKAQDLSRCPTCGTRPSGALGEAALNL